MKVRIGINPITWTNDDVPELGGDTPLEICLSETREAGYAGIELGGKFPRVCQQIVSDPRQKLWHTLHISSYPHRIKSTCIPKLCY